MDMDMEDRLPGAGQAISDDSKPPFVETQLTCDLDRGQLQFAEQKGVLGVGIEEGGEVLLGNDQDVRWGLWLEIVKGDDIVVFIGDVRGQLACGDSAEDTVGHE
jgi:hypothetical protein